MTRTAQRLAIIGTITISLLAYLFHVPNGEGVAQMNRIRLLSATMKTIKFMVSMLVVTVMKNYF
jgi:hypothetical protein